MVNYVGTTCLSDGMKATSAQRKAIFEIRNPEGSYAISPIFTPQIGTKVRVVSDVVDASIT